MKIKFNSCLALIYDLLAEVPGIARVIIRLAAIPPTSRLDHSSTSLLHTQHEADLTLEADLALEAHLALEADLAPGSDPFCF